MIDTHLQKFYSLLCLKQKDLNTENKQNKPARAVGRVEDFIVEYGEVKSQTQTNRVCRLKVCHCNITSSFVSNQTVFCSLLPVISCGKLSKIPVVITLPEASKEEKVCLKHV